MTAIFLFFSVLIISTSLGVLLLKNPVYSALSLIACLLSVAGVFAMMDAHFLAVVQIVVYAGAIMVLVLFVLMLLNLKIENTNSKMFIPGSIAIALAVFVVFGFLNLLPGGLVPDKFVAMQIPSGDAKSIGELLFKDYLFPFEFASVLIMSALVGAVLLGKTKYKR